MSDKKEIKVTLDADVVSKLDALVAKSKVSNPSVSRAFLIRVAVDNYLASKSTTSSDSLMIGG